MRVERPLAVFYTFSMKTKPGMHTRQFFGHMLKRTPRNARALDAKIHKACAVEKTIVSCDSSGFSRKTHEHGIIQFMDNMVKCHDALERIVKKHGGTTLSDKADNLTLIFDEPCSATACAIEMLRWLKKRNKGLTEKRRHNMCMGIHHGYMLRFADDAYGPAVNVSFKLGEDIAGKDELLVTRQVNEMIEDRFPTEYAKHVTIGGITFDVFKVKYR